jgi:S-adenosyl-L-methionine hydrolase (adenosine-forming)
MTTPSPIITLMTDFGTQDGYVGAMKGVILGIQPQVRIIDITHNIEAQNIEQAASILSDYYPFYPPHTVHVVVVDPGVGSARDPIAVETSRGKFIAPDNGVLTHMLYAEKQWKAVRLENAQYWLPNPSNTFHGRDIFSPAAAHLAGGVPLDDLGLPMNDLYHFSVPDLSITSQFIKGEVVRIDHFGNVITNIKNLVWIDDSTLEFQRPGSDDKPAKRLDARKAHVMISWHSMDGIYKTFSDAPKGQRLALVGSGGQLEISVNQGNASEVMAIKVGDPVTIQLHS